MHDNAELRAVVADRTVPTDAKATLLASIFKSKVSAPTLAVLTQAAAIRGGSFEKVIDRFIRQIADRQGEIVAVVVQGQLRRQPAKYGRPVQLNLVVDPSIVGGISVSVGDEVVDATMSTRLESARRLIAG